jgi:alpha-galactosidase
MGWNSWNFFSSNINAETIKAIADAMVQSGMREAGYQYVNIDDAWMQAERAADGSIQFAAGFPDGIAPVAEYVHNLGLKLGIYSDRGTMTCQKLAGSQGYEVQDANSYAAWGVDYLKYDNCFVTLDAETQYRTMRDALAATGRPIVYSLCAWGFFEWGVGLGQLWRTTTDIQPYWSSDDPQVVAHTVTSIMAGNGSLAAYAGPNGWNDPDMLEVGNAGLGVAEARAHFSMWAIMAAPLIAGNDLRNMNPIVQEILTNREVIDVDQDWLGLQGVPVWTDRANLEVWAKPLNESGSRAVALLNKGSGDQAITVRFADAGLGPGEVAVRDLWTHTDLGTFTDSYTATVGSHSVVMLKLSGYEPQIPKGTSYLSDLPWIYAANATGPVEKDRSNGATALGDGSTISLRGTTYAKGLGVAAGSMILYRLSQNCQTFSAEVGVDDETKGQGSVVFRVYTDQDPTPAFDSGFLTGASPAQSVRVDLTGKKRLKLLVTNGGDGSGWDRASWADAKLECLP